MAGSLTGQSAMTFFESSSRSIFLFEHDRRAKRFAFVPRQDQYPLFRIMLYRRCGSKCPEQASDP